MYLKRLRTRSFRLPAMIAVVGLLCTLSSATPFTANPEKAGATPPTLQVEAGHNFTCVLKDGGVKCVGKNNFGQLGNGVPGGDRSQPVDVVGLTSGVSDLALGAFHACVIVNGGVKCWGYNSYGQLGNGSDGLSSAPVSVIGLESGVSAISLGDYHSCAIVDGGAQCWGYNEEYGALGDGNLNNMATPVPVIGLESGVSALALGGFFSCAIVNASVKCWGYGLEGELGNGSATSSPTPVTVTGLSGVDAIAAGVWHACALTSGSVKCWGWGDIGQIGDGNYTYENSTPVQVTGLSTGVSAIALGGDTSCALVGGGVKCWGENGSGQLGDGSQDGSSSPVSALNLSSVSAISIGASHSCAIAEGDVQCWGSDSNTELVNGTASWYTSSSEWSDPVDVTDESSFTYPEMPEIVVDSTGLATAIWSEYDGESFVIRSSTSQSGGDWSTPVVVADPGEGQHAFEPKLTVDSTGLVTAVWTCSVTSTQGSYVQSSRSTSGGTWTPVQNVSDVADYAQSPDLTVDSNGLVTAVWADYEFGWLIRSRTSQSGSDWSPQADLSNRDQEAQNPQVTVDSAGVVTAVWLWWTGTQWRVQSKASQSGGDWTQEVTDLSVIDGNDLNVAGYPPQVVADSDGTVTVIWTVNVGGNWAIQSRTKVNGEEWSPFVTLSPESGSAGDAKLAVNSSGLVAAIWTWFDGADGEVVQVRTLDLPGTWSNSVNLFSTHPGCSSDEVGECVGKPEVFVESSGRVTAIWNLSSGDTSSVQTSYSESVDEWSTPTYISEPNGESDGQQLTVDSTGLAIAIWIRYEGGNGSIQSSTRFSSNSSSPSSSPSVGTPNSFTVISTTLAKTGATFEWLMLIGVLALSAGAGLFALSRRKLTY
jgi:LPXTG-motif cell wall-anchored protein